jgi:hypothetical protein
MVKTAYSFQLLNTRQVEALLFLAEGRDHTTLTSVCRRRLQLLWQHEFLHRIIPSVSPAEGRPNYVYCLDRRGADLVAELLEIDREEVNWRARDKRVKPLFLNHALRVSDVRVAITCAARLHGYPLLRWVDERQFKSAREKVPHPEKPGRSLPFEPDGFFALRVGNRKACFFLELDRASMQLSRFQDKVRAYDSYRRSGKSLEAYETRNFRVLTVTTAGEKRLAHISKRTEEAGGDDRFWFATFDRVIPEVLTAKKEKRGLHDLGAILSSPLWQTAGDEELRRLIQQ